MIKPIDKESKKRGAAAVRFLAFLLHFKNLRSGELAPTGRIPIGPYSASVGTVMLLIQTPLWTR